jgi:hypothetical protein
LELTFKKAVIPTKGVFGQSEVERSEPTNQKRASTADAIKRHLTLFALCFSFYSTGPRPVSAAIFEPESNGRSGLQRCQIFLDTKYQNGKIYQITVKYTKWPQIMFTTLP